MGIAARSIPRKTDACKSCYKRLGEIHFHFTSGHDFSSPDYCQGKRPVAVGKRLRFLTTSPVEPTHASLRRYLDVVYTYAGTISLARELKDTTTFAIVTIVITPGSLGHCFIIADEATTPAGDTVYQLVEGYSPAQSIYVLKTLQNRNSIFGTTCRKAPFKQQVARSGTIT